MIYNLELKGVGMAAGLLLVAAHGIALLSPEASRKWLVAMPRSRAVGIAFLAIAAAWAFFLVQGMDLGEFSSLRGFMLGGIVVGAILTALYVPEFLAVRALGMLALLAAEPLLGAAFLRPELSRLLIVCLAYGWIIAGLFWVGIPWVLRDQVAWLLAAPARFKAAIWAGLAYGVAIVTCAVLHW